MKPTDARSTRMTNKTIAETKICKCMYRNNRFLALFLCQFNRGMDANATHCHSKYLQYIWQIFNIINQETSVFRSILRACCFQLSQHGNCSDLLKNAQIKTTMCAAMNMRS